MVKIGYQALIVVVVIATALVATPAAEAATLKCQQVTNYLMPCYTYLMRGGQPSKPCCNGVTELYKRAKTPPLRRDACNCMKEAATRYMKKMKAEAASHLFEKCDVKLEFPISEKIDCKRIR